MNFAVKHPDEPNETPRDFMPGVRELADLLHAQMDGRLVFNVQVDAEGRPIACRDAGGSFSIGMAMVPLDQIRASVALMDPQSPVVLTLQEAALIGRMAAATLKRRVNEGAFKKVVKRGKPLLFFRDLFIQELMRDR